MKQSYAELKEDRDRLLKALKGFDNWWYGPFITGLTNAGFAGMKNGPLTRKMLADVEEALSDPENKRAVVRECPFDQGPETHDLGPNDPCPVCGDLGTMESLDEPSHCISFYRPVPNSPKDVS